MNSGFNDYQDLINQTTTGEDLASLEAEITALENEVADNKTNIATNTTNISLLNNDMLQNRQQIINNENLILTNISNISTNATNIATNTSNISTNTSNISTNTSNISTNATNIATNTSNIATLNNTVLLRDGSIDLDVGYNPSNSQSIATKNYVDTHSTSGNYLRVDGTNSMTADLNLANNNLININELVFNIATVSELNNVLDFKMGLNNVLRLQTNIISTFTNLDMNNNNIVNVNDLQFPNALITEFSNILFFSTGGSTLFTIASLEIDAFTNLNMNNNQITNTSNIISSGNISCVDINASGNISCVDINASGNVEILGDINFEANQIMDYGYNATNRATNTTEGKITYSTITSQYTLNIYGGLDATAQSQGVNRLTQIFGDVYVGDINTFHINSGSGANGDCKLILEADDDNTNEQSTPQILMKADGGLIEGAIYLNNNTLDIVNSVSSGGGIRFLTTTTDGDYTNGNLALGITNDNQDVVVERNLGIQEAVDVDSRCYLQFARNNANRDLSIATGQINYQTNQGSYGHVLNIIGGRSGTSGSRQIFMSDSVHVEDFLTVFDSTNIGNSSQTNTSNAGLNIFGCSDEVGSYTSGSGNDTIYNQIFIRYPGASTSTGTGSYGWILGNQTQTPSSGDLDFYFNVLRDGTISQPAYIADNTGLTKMNFTGQHRNYSNNLNIGLVGLIVVSIGKYRNLISNDEEKICNKNSITINDSLPLVELCNEIKSKKVFGVLSNEEEKDKRKYESGNFVSMYNQLNGDQRFIINSVGEGAIWVHNNNGNIENGDYICSYLNGYGQKQDEVQLCNFTVAKSTMDCDFNPALELVQLYDGVDENGKIKFKPATDDQGNDIYEPEYECITLDDGSKIAFIGCTYHCG